MRLSNDDVANILEQFGADRSDDLRKLIAHEIQAEESKAASASHEQSNGRMLETHIEDSDRSGENIDALLMQAASSFKGR